MEHIDAGLRKRGSVFGVRSVREKPRGIVGVHPRQSDGLRGWIPEIYERNIRDLGDKTAAADHGARVLWVAWRNEHLQEFPVGFRRAFKQKSGTQKKRYAGQSDGLRGSGLDDFQKNRFGFPVLIQRHLNRFVRSFDQKRAECKPTVVQAKRAHHVSAAVKRKRSHSVASRCFLADRRKILV